MLKLALMFQDHMVIQREKMVCIWGSGDIGEVVTASMQGKTSSAGVAQDGKWRMMIGPFKTSFQETMTITGGEEKVVLKDIQVGEVWLAGGQSNMEFAMRYDADYDMEKTECTNDALRFFDYPEVSYVGQIDEADYGKNYGFWRKASPEQLERFSAVGYYFAKEIQEKYQIPIGIIGCNWGGTPACAWMSEEAVIKGGGQVYLDEYDEAVRSLNLNEYEKKFKDNPALWKTDLFNDPVGEMLLYGCSMEEFWEKIIQPGLDLKTLDPADFIPQMGPKNEQRPCGLYESMLKEVSPYTIRGIIWYQGEADGDRHPELYKTLFPALIEDWRDLWQEQLPFLFVQIAPLEQWIQCMGQNYIEIRRAQQYAADNTPNTGMAVITDVGMQFDIHPKKKQPVGHRLALLARKKVYKEDILCEAPLLKEIWAEDGKLILTFVNTGEGLYLAEKLPFGETIENNRLGGLQIFREGHELNGELLKAEAENDKVIVYGSEIRADVPTEVRIAETGWHLVNLYNSADIPARPASRRI